MKALTIKQPYADAIFKGWKPYEIRTRRTHFRGEFVVHAGAKLDKYSDYAAMYCCIEGSKCPLGVGIGVARIVACIPYMDIAAALSPQNRLFCPPFGDWAWQLEVVERWDTPIPAKGKLGFWEWID